MRSVRSTVTIALASAVLGIGAAPASAAAPSSDAEAYCESSGGQVQLRQPTYGTNNDRSSWVALGEPVAVCRFAADDEAHSKIHVDLVTLSSPQPTLAALAYLAKLPIPTATGGANPAAVFCSDLGGTSTFGLGVAGGGLVLADAPADEHEVVAPCTFADGSFIDDWGIAYYADGTIRGTDLAELFRFDPTTIPNIYG